MTNLRSGTGERGSLDNCTMHEEGNYARYVRKECWHSRLLPYFLRVLDCLLLVIVLVISGRFLYRLRAFEQRECGGPRSEDSDAGLVVDGAAVHVQL